MKKLSGLMIVCIPLYVWGSESFSVNLSLYETPRYAMSTSYDDRYSPIISTYRSPNAIDYLLEGVGGVVGGVAGGVAGGFVGLLGAVAATTVLWPSKLDEEYGSLEVGAIGFLLGAPAGVLFGIPAGVTITGDVIVGCKGSYWESLLGTAVGIVAGVGFMALTGPTPISLVSVTFPIYGAVWGYHWRKKDK